MLFSTLTASLIGMSGFAIFGGFSFKQYALTQETLWLVAGFASYALSNVLFILLIGENGLARSMAIASAAQIILATIIGIYFRENLNLWHFISACLCCAAITLSMVGDRATAGSSQHSSHGKFEEETNG